MMVKFKVKHTCGHEVTHAYAGPEGGQLQREEWLQRRPCQVCWRNEQAGAAAAQGQNWNLPPLEGSEQDVAWAEVIRAKAIAHNREYHERLVRSKGLGSADETLRHAIIAAADEALREIEGQSSAVWWIEHKFDALTHIRQKTAAAITPIMDNPDAESPHGNKDGP